ncbi:MAG: porin [Betaproteobacteria bacterium]|nr:porin [Betaproteobacteria bacterium]
MKLGKLTLVVSAILAAPCALAEVEVYGKVYPELFSLSSSGATAAGATVSTLSAAPTGLEIKSRLGQSANNSRIGFKGKEALGGGLDAIYQIETQVNTDDGTGTALATRNSFVGLTSAAGTLMIGINDTPFKRTNDSLSFFGISSGNFVSTSTIMRKVGFGTSSSSSFHLRRRNSVDYETPDMNGVAAAVQWSTDEAISATNDKIPTALSMGVWYDKGPLYVGLAYESHDNFFAGSRNVGAALRNNGAASGASSKDTAMQASVKYKFGGHQVEVNVIQKNYTEDPIAAGRFKSYKNTAYSLGMESRLAGNWRAAFHFLKAQAGTCERGGGAACDATGLDGTQISLGTAYDFNKNTMAFAFLSRVTNGTSAVFNTSDVDPAAGADLQILAAGLSYRF